VELLRGSDSGRVAVAIAAVVGALRGDIFALRGLRELPDFGEADAALGRAWRVV
jgi:ABC-type transporter Mla maintaining outer membrane lipid asymmetry permease subunit MlaE